MLQWVVHAESWFEWNSFLSGILNKVLKNAQFGEVLERNVTDPLVRLWGRKIEAKQSIQWLKMVSIKPRTRIIIQNTDS